MCPTILVEKWKCKLETTYLSKGQVAKKKWENISCWTIAWRRTKRIYNSDWPILMSIHCFTVCKFKIFQPFRFYVKSNFTFLKRKNWLGVARSATPTYIRSNGDQLVYYKGPNWGSFGSNILFVGGWSPPPKWTHNYLWIKLCITGSVKAYCDFLISHYQYQMTIWV